MPENLQGIVIGGLIALVPTFLSLLFQYLFTRMNQRHELRLRMLDTFESKRLAVLDEYMSALGPFLSHDKVTVGELEPAELDALISAHQQAALYVSAETFSAMNAALPVILASGESRHAHSSTPQLLRASEVSRLLDLLRLEMQASKNTYLSQTKHTRRK